MIKIKKIFIFIIFLFITIFYINSNEFKQDNKNIQISTIKKNLSFSINYTDNINFKDKIRKNNISFYPKNVKTFLYMGIIGSGVLALGLLTTGTGLIFMTTYSWTGNVSSYLQYTGAIMFIVGSGLFIIGLPFMIVGFVLFVKTKNRMNAFINTDNVKQLSVGFSIKI